MSDDSNIKIGRDALHEFYTRHIDGDSLPIHRMTLREKNASYGKDAPDGKEG